MLDDIIEIIMLYLKNAAIKGHYEHSYSDIKEGIRNDVNIPGTRIFQVIGSMEDRKLIESRKKGRATYYTIAELRALCESAWKDEKS